MHNLARPNCVHTPYYGPCNGTTANCKCYLYCPECEQLWIDCDGHGAQYIQCSICKTCYWDDLGHNCSGSGDGENNGGGDDGGSTGGNNGDNENNNPKVNFDLKSKPFIYDSSIPHLFVMNMTPAELTQYVRIQGNQLTCALNAAWYIGALYGDEVCLTVQDYITRYVNYEWAVNNLFIDPTQQGCQVESIPSFLAFMFETVDVSNNFYSGISQGWPIQTSIKLPNGTSHDIVVVAIKGTNNDILVYMDSTLRTFTGSSYRPHRNDKLHHWRYRS